MATELAKAYVQIIPTTKGIQSQLNQELGGAGEQAGTMAGTSAGSKLVSFIKKAIAAAGIGAALKSAISEGADLQQSLGGVETLFKDNADMVKAYAAEAYKTTGLSANAYMESVTGFSASLLQGLGGDTAKAADVANMAMVDMSDNANKMGTDMSSIQYAYQGFAKQNYTMLDNLKLGYGGTKSEMERLLADATKISGVKYDMSNLSDVYSAIHVIQGELDITGTTAKEAATTLSGSLASMKSAFQNLIGNLSIGESIAPALSALGETVFTFLTDNLFPMVGNVLSGLPTVIESALSMGIRGMNLLAKNAGSIVQSGIDIVSKLIVGVTSAIPYMIESAVSIASSFIKTLVETDWKSVASDLISSIKSNMDVAAGEILGTDGNIIQSVVSAITTNAPAVIAQGAKIVNDIIIGITSALPEIVGAIPELIGYLIEVFTACSGPLLDAGTDIVNTLLNGVILAIPVLLEAVPQIIDTLSSAILEFLPLLMETGVQLLSALVGALPQIISQIVKVLPQIISSINKTLITMIPVIIQCGIQLLTSLVSALPTIISAIVSVLPTIINSIVSVVISNVPVLIQAGIQLLTALIGALPQIISTIAGALPQIINSIVQTLSSNMPAIIQCGVQLLTSLVKNIPAIISGLVAAVPQIISSLVGAFSGAVSSFADVGKNMLLGIGNGISNAVGSVVESAKKAASNILGGVKKFFGIKSPSRVFRDQIGKNLMLGLAGGIEGNMGAVSDAISDVTQMTTGSFDSELAVSASTQQDVLSTASAPTDKDSLWGMILQALREMRVVLDSGETIGWIDSALAAKNRLEARGVV